MQPALEPNSQSDNQTYQTVTIHSDFEHVTWGSLQPEVIGDVQWQIKEANSMYMSVMLTYQVDCVGEEKDTKENSLNSSVCGIRRTSRCIFWITTAR